MLLQLQHYKDVEISKVKMEEKDKSRKEILQLRQDMERTYEMKSGALINREKNAIDRLQKQQEVVDSQFSNHRVSGQFMFYLGRSIFLNFLQSGVVWL